MAGTGRVSPVTHLRRALCVLELETSQAPAARSLAAAASAIPGDTPVGAPRRCALPPTPQKRSRKKGLTTEPQRTQRETGETLC